MSTLIVKPLALLERFKELHGNLTYNEIFKGLLKEHLKRKDPTKDPVKDPVQKKLANSDPNLVRPDEVQDEISDTPHSTQLFNEVTFVKRIVLICDSKAQFMNQPSCIFSHASRRLVE